MRNWILFLPIVVGGLLWAGAAQAQEEASIKLTARVLSTSAAGTSSGVLVESEVGGSSGDEGTEQPAGQTSRSEVPRKLLVLRGQNQVLVEVQTPTAVECSIVSFSRGRTETVDVGTLEEETTVHIIHLGI